MLKVCFFCLIGLFATVAHGERLTITVAAPNIPPFISSGETSGEASESTSEGASNQPIGILVELLKQVEKTENITFDIKILPWARALKQVENNHIDAIMPALYDEQRAQYLRYPKAAFYTLDNNVLLVLSTSDFQFSGFASIGTEKLLGKMRSAKVSKKFAAAVSKGQLNVFEAKNIEQAIKMLFNNKLDMVVADGAIAQSELERLHMAKQIKLIHIPEQSVPSYLAFSRKFANNHDINALMDLINLAKN